MKRRNSWGKMERDGNWAGKKLGHVLGKRWATRR